MQPFKMAETVMDTRQICEQGGQVLGLKPETELPGLNYGHAVTPQNGFELVHGFSYEFRKDQCLQISVPSHNPPTNCLWHFPIKTHHFPTIPEAIITM